MEFTDFENIVKREKAEHPILFDLEHDRIPQRNEVMDLQRQHQIQLPEKYIQFLLRYGGGYFGYANLYSLDPDSDFFLFRQNQEPLGQFLCIADNGCGDMYALPIEEGRCQDTVVLLAHDEEKIYETGFSDVLEYLVQVGLAD